MTTNLIEQASASINQLVNRHSLGDDIYWSLSPMLVPTPNGPQAVYGLMMHMRSPVIGNTLTTFSIIENPLDLLNDDELERHVQTVCEGLKESRSEMLSSTSPLQSEMK